MAFYPTTEAAAEALRGFLRARSVDPATRTIPGRSPVVPGLAPVAVLPAEGDALLEATGRAQRGMYAHEEI